MAFNFNKVQIGGYLGNDPEVKSLPGGQTVTEFSLAISEKYKDKETTHWVRVSAWGRTGEIIADYFSKGSPILIDGRLNYREWESKEGQKRSALTVTANGFSFMPRNNGDSGKNQSRGNSRQESSSPSGGDGGFDTVPF